LVNKNQLTNSIHMRAHSLVLLTSHTYPAHTHFSFSSFFLSKRRRWSRRTIPLAFLPV
jgi:hypothetical protein